ncbi:MAG: hypothetical protein V1910_00625 [bacterium]
MDEILKEEVKVKGKAKVKKGLPVFAWFIIGILVGAGMFYIWNLYTAKPATNKVANQMEQAQVKELVAKVSKLIILPTGEEPVVATINDAEALIKDQVFYKGSKNGDVVLVYQKNAKAVIYSPEKNIIVNVGPVVFNNQPAAPNAVEPAPVKK